MELKMEVYSPELELIGILETYKTVIWEEYAFKAGSFSVEAIISGDTASLLSPDNIIWISDDSAGIIESIEDTVGDDGPYITAKGPMLSGIMERRILWGTYNLSGNAQSILYNLVNDCAVAPTRGDFTYARVIPGLALDAPETTSGESIRIQRTGGTLMETVQEIGETYNVAFGIRFNAQLQRMEFWARNGVDRSVEQSINDQVFYSTELDDVLTSEYSYDSSEYKNVALVAGEDTEDGRRYLAVTNSFQSGLSRRELWVDARDLQSESSDPDGEAMSDSEYEEVMNTRGLEKLSENQLVQSFNSTVRTTNPTYEYGVDFMLGDKITVTDERLGITVSAIVQGVQKTFGTDGETMSLILGYEQPTIHERLKTKAVK